MGFRKKFKIDYHSSTESQECQIYFGFLGIKWKLIWNEDAKIVRFADSKLSAKVDFFSFFRKRGIQIASKLKWVEVKMSIRQKKNKYPKHAIVLSLSRLIHIAASFLSIPSTIFWSFFSAEKVNLLYLNSNLLTVTSIFSHNNCFSLHKSFFEPSQIALLVILFTWFFGVFIDNWLPSSLNSINTFDCICKISQLVIGKSFYRFILKPKKNFYLGGSESHVPSRKDRFANSWPGHLLYNLHKYCSLVHFEPFYTVGGSKPTLGAPSSFGEASVLRTFHKCVFFAFFHRWIRKTQLFCYWFMG